MEINLKTLATNNLTPSEYCWLYRAINSQQKDNPWEKEIIKSLEEKGFLKQTEDDVVIREKAIRLFYSKTSESLFLELYNTYPIHVVSTKGKRILRTTGTETKLYKDLLKKYNGIIKADEKYHRHIMNCLDIELDIRRKSNDMGYLQQLEVWINQRTWEKYQHILEEQQKVVGSEDRYGESIKT